MSACQPASISYSSEQNKLVCAGQWTIYSINQLEQTADRVLARLPADVSIDGREISGVDSAGALLLHEFMQSLKASGKTISSLELMPKFNSLLEMIEVEDSKASLKPRFLPSTLYKLGRAAVKKLKECFDFINFLGLFFHTLGKLGKNMHRLHWRSILVTIDEAGYEALPIVALLTFLIGVVLTYQVAIQLQTYGANIYVVDLTGIIIFREFGPLTTAIIIAGRTSTAFTAQIGTMKVNEELDALNTMGVSPMDCLVIPKFLAMLVALPLLVVWSDIFGILGAMLMSKIQLHVGYSTFLDRFQHQIAVKHFIAGLIKVPVFAMLISLVGCYQGFRVGNSADSVGRKTTQSAVQSIFLIIIADAVFSIIYSIKGF